MKVTKNENGISLTPENDWEKECLQKIADRPVDIKWSHPWAREGSLDISVKLHPWDRIK